MHKISVTLQADILALDNVTTGLCYANTGIPTNIFHEIHIKKEKMCSAFVIVYTTLSSIFLTGKNFYYG